MMSTESLRRSETYAVAALLLAALLCVQAQGQCYIDAYGNQVCTQPGYGWQSASAYDGARWVRDVPSPQPQAGREAPLPWRCRVAMANGNVGSGSLISRNSVITNYHVVEGSSGATISFPSGQRVQGQVIATDPVYDLAILRVPNTGIEPPEINDTDPTGPLCAGGFGGDGRFLAVRGTVTGHVVYDGASIPCPKMRGVNRPGDSGGGVVNQSKQFVGVQWGSRDGEVYITSGRPLARFLDSVFPYRTGAIVPRATPIARRSGGSVGRPPLEPVQPVPLDELDPGPPVDRPEPEIDYEAWEQWQEEIRQQQAQTQQQLQSLMIKIDGIKGEPGPAGPQGPPGPAGISPQIDYDELAEAVAARLTHSATITLLDGTRKTQTRPLNEALEFIQHSRAKTPE